MNVNPILVELARNGNVESIYRGAFAVSDAQGRILVSVGDIARPVFPRSAIKSMQALALFRSGAVEKFALGDPFIALACASHDAEDVHVATARETLDRIGLGIEDLECGAHPPTSRATRDRLRQDGAPFSAIHNNCSGKHTGMLADALALGVPVKGYIDPRHPVQVLVRQCVEDVIGEPLSEDICGTDGCSLPAWTAPLSKLAKGFARMATGEGLPGDLVEPAKKIFDAATANPRLVRGTDKLDTDVMEAFGGRVMLKMGAEGVYCGAVRDTGVGFALKIDDGKPEAAEVLVANLLLALAEPNENERRVLDRFAKPIQKNWNKLEVAQLRPTKLASPSLS